MYKKINIIYDWFNLKNTDNKFENKINKTNGDIKEKYNLLVSDNIYSSMKFTKRHMIL